MISFIAIIFTVIVACGVWMNHAERNDRNTHAGMISQERRVIAWLDSASAASIDSAVSASEDLQRRFAWMGMDDEAQGLHERTAWNKYRVAREVRDGKRRMG